jgi:hypothetical protein
MSLLRPQTYKAVRQAGALLLVLWLGGFACLTTCAGTVLADSSDNCDLSIKPITIKPVTIKPVKKSVEQECKKTVSKPVEKATSCCKLTAKKPKQKSSECKAEKTASPKSSTVISTTTQKFQTTVPAFSTVEQNSSPVPCRMKCCPINRDLAEPASSRFSNVHVENQNLVKAEAKPEQIAIHFSPPLQTRDRGDTYLRCCIFLI